MYMCTKGILKSPDGGFQMAGDKNGKKNEPVSLISCFKAITSKTICNLRSESQDIPLANLNTCDRFD